MDHVDTYIHSNLFTLPSSYKLISFLGQGTYGIVCKAEIDNMMVAIKKNYDVFQRHILIQKRLARELKILQHLKHRNIIELLDLPPPKDYSNYQDIYITTNLMETDLKTIINSQQPLSDDQIRLLMFHLLTGIQYMHSCNVIHLDLKPANILVNSNLDLRICDFGLSLGIDEEEDLEMTTPYVVTRYYRSPELLMLHNMPFKAIDIWSAGCILAELYNRKPLFSAKDYVTQLATVVNALGMPDLNTVLATPKVKKYLAEMEPQKPKPFEELVPRAPPVVIDLLKKMLTIGPNERITATEALHHPFFAKYHNHIETPEEDPIDLSFEDSLKDAQGIRETITSTIKDFQVTQTEEN